MTTFRVVLATIVTLVVLVVLWSWQLMRPGPPIRLSKQTTYITEPLAVDGLPDYVAYLDHKYGEGVTPENNATVLLLRATGLPEVTGADRDQWFARLGMENLPQDGKYLTLLSQEPAVVGVANWMIAYWRSRDQGGEPPSMVGLPDYGELIADAYGQGYGTAGPHWSYHARSAAEELTERVGQRPWSSSRLPPVAAWLKDNEHLLDVVVEASKRPRMYAPLLTRTDNVGPQLIAVMLPTVQGARNPCRGLRIRVMNRLGEGRFTEAQTDMAAMHRLARLVGGGPTVVHYFVGLAFDQIACQQQITLASLPDVPVKTLETSLEQLRGFERWRSMADRFDETERLSALDAALSLCRRPDRIEFGRGGNSEVVAGLAGTNIDWNVVLERINGYYDDLAAASRDPDNYHLQQRLVSNESTLDDSSESIVAHVAGAAISRRTRSEWIADWIAHLMLPASRAALDVEVRTNIGLDLAKTSLGLALYHARHGEYPATLDALVPNVLDRVPLDLFADAPFHYERREDGYLLYSVGDRGEDDGGTNREKTIVGGEWVETSESVYPEYENRPNADDLVVRVPMPALVIPPLPDDVELPPLSKSDELIDTQPDGATTQE